MDKIRAMGCPATFRPLEEAVQDYVTGHLAQPDPRL